MNACPNMGSGTHVHSLFVWELLTIPHMRFSGWPEGFWASGFAVQEDGTGLSNICGILGGPPW